MLSTTFIRHSTSNFSISCSFVKKKDGRWRFWGDYKALNDITIEDRFHIPIVDELIDERYDSNFLSKLDLRSCCR